MPTRRRHGAFAVLLLVVASCSAKPPSVATDGTTIENCGSTVRVDQPPTRTVALDQETTETLLALGLADEIVGTALPLAPVAEEYRAAYEKIPLLNPKDLTAEQLRAANPDFAASAVTTDFTRERVGTREELATLGVRTYASTADCPAFSADASPFDRLFTDFTNFGAIFQIPDRAESLVRQQRQVISDATSAAATRESKPSVAYLYSLHDGTMAVAGGGGLPSNMSKILGVRNLFDDADGDWTEVSAEQLVARNPSVLVLADLPDLGEVGASAKDKIAMLRADAVLSQTDAVREGRFISVPGLELDPTVRSVDALRLINDGLAKLS